MTITIRVDPPGMNSPPLLDSAGQEKLRRLTEAYILPSRSSIHPTPSSEPLRQLDALYRKVRKQLLRHQSYTTGLYPRFSNDTTEGYVRDSIYCAIATWAVSMAYDRQDDDRGRQYEMGQSAVKTMRGILLSWMMQSNILENFKKSHREEFALHAKFDLESGEALGDDGFKHLQLDVVPLYLITLVQMISGGLQIIFTQEEVTFIQNLVFYIERAYRTPGYGMWEQGTRYNDGTPELHASSLGMVKAALEAINGFNLYGSRGTAGSVIYVDIDAHNRNRTTFETILPRESHSKNVDASLIAAIMFPAFATHDQTVFDKTLDKCHRKLEGKHGFRRFLRDGYRTAIENRQRQHYSIHETSRFDGIESQWPMFFLYLVIDNLFRGKDEDAHAYWNKMQKLLVYDSEGTAIVPMCYYVPEKRIPFEKKHPGTEKMVPVDHEQEGVFLWAQALYFIASLLKDGLIALSDIDPIHRHLPASQRPKYTNRHSVFQIERDSGPTGDVRTGMISGDPVVQVALISESVKLQAALSTYGIQTQTPHHVEPVQIWPSGKLVKVFNNLGQNERLGLSGRPDRPIGSLGTCKIYRVFGETVLCYPILFDIADFYISYDPKVLINDIKKDLHFIANRWKLAGRPTFCVLLREQNVTGDHFPQMLELLVALKTGNVDGIRVRVGRLQNLLSASCVEHLDFADENLLEMLERELMKPMKTSEADSRFESLRNINQSICAIETDTDFDIQAHKDKTSEDLIAMFKGLTVTSLRTQASLLEELWHRHSEDYCIDGKTMRESLEKVLQEAGVARNWSVVRFCASRLRKVIDSLAPSITTILVHGKEITLGMRGFKETRIVKPVTPNEIVKSIYECFPPDKLTSAVVTQELIIAISHIIATEPKLFLDILTIKVGWMIDALEMLLEYRNPPRADDSSNGLKHTDSSVSKMHIADTKLLLYKLSPTELKKLTHDLLAQRRWNRLSPLQQRQLNGAMNKVPVQFYNRVWRMLERSSGGIVVAEQHLPQQPTISDMTLYELNFALLIEKLLTKIPHPEYRQLMIELVTVIDTILERNPELRFTDQVDLDDLIHDAFGLFAAENGIKGTDMTPFYELTAGHVYKGTAPSYMAKAVVNSLLCADHTSSRKPQKGGESETCYVS